jgi:hypothetical protein
MLHISRQLEETIILRGITLMRDRPHPPIPATSARQMAKKITQQGLLNNLKMRPCHQTMDDQKKIEIVPGVFKKHALSLAEGARPVLS